MSDFASYGLILTFLVSGTFVMMYGAKRSNERSDQIVSGLVDGASVSTRHRWIMLYNDFVPNVAIVAMLSFLLAFGMVGIADIAENDHARVLAWMCAVFGGFGFLFNLIVGSVYVAYCASAIRQAEGR